MSMRHVTFAKPQAPHGVGDKRLVSEAVAKQLHDEGVIADLGEPFPARHSAKARKPKRPVVAPGRGGGQLDLRIAE